MESRFSEYGINANCIVWNQDRRKGGCTASRDAIRPMGNFMQFAKQIDAIHKPFGLE
jgi:hypothetical protein